MLDPGFYNMDCMDGMKEFPDKYFDLAIVDPPYAIEKAFNATSRIEKYGDMHTVNDLRPNKDYFSELMRVSKNQIVWGFNHLCDLLPPTKEFVFWYKHQPVDTYSDGELAWTSFTKTAKCFDYAYYGSVGADDIRIHPTQKPVKLYKWLLETYMSEGGCYLTLMLALHHHWWLAEKRVSNMLDLKSILVFIKRQKRDWTWLRHKSA